MKKKVIVIGAGAAGLMAAISAARHGADVTILEAQELPGKKLLVTGNGRCNLTNLAENLSEQYHGTGAALAKALTGEFDAADTLRFFRSLGLLTYEKNGYVYPYTSQASSVLDVLLAELRRLKVKLKFSQNITQVVDHSAKEGSFANEKNSTAARFSVVTPSWVYQADAVVLACGSKAAPSTGAGEDGYFLARDLGHRILRLRPALVPFLCSPGFPEQAFAGVRCRARVTLLSNPSGVWNDTMAKEIAADTGELQWTGYGVSGIVIFQLSRYLSPAGEKPRQKSSLSEKTERSHDILRIDFLPDYTGKELKALLFQRKTELEREAPSVLLRGLLNPKLLPLILSRAGKGKVPKSCRELSEAFIDELVHQMKAYRLPVTGTKSFDQAQICMGGIDCRELSGRLESCLHEGLFFAGEMLDVDGPCGGYNLQWAWTSGYLAGKYAAFNHARQ